MKTFLEHLTEDMDMKLFEEYMAEAQELTPEQEQTIDETADRLLRDHEDGKDLEVTMNEIIEEGLLGSILGGLTGFALGKSVGKMIAKVLGIQKGVLYDLLTSRLVGAALGATIGKRF
jgi:uncharacterized protein YcfJ|tara:strand:+ start:3932 stop:4285 length:354 start_codon:yes stop_codon:yes gene_type:complete